MPRRRNSSKPRTPKPRTTKKWVRKVNWLELPTEITANILHRLGAIEILESAQKVCTTWRNICRDPAMWRVIDMQNLGDLSSMPYDLEKMCMHAVDRSQGLLVDIKFDYFGTDKLMEYIANRASHLKRLEISCCYGMIYEFWSEFLKKAPLLEEIALTFTDISKEAIADAGRYCPLLKSFKYNDKGCRHDKRGYNMEIASLADETVIAITKSMNQLHSLQLIGNKMTNNGLQAIIDGCPHLEFLDLRRCFNIKLDGRLGKLCKEKIKYLRLPGDAMEGYKFVAEDDYHVMVAGSGDDCDFDGLSDDYEGGLSDYEGGLSDYEIYCGPHQNVFDDMFDDDNPGELSPSKEFVAYMHAMHIGHLSDSD